MPTNPERARDARHAIAEIVIAHGGQWSGAVDAAISRRTSLRSTRRVLPRP